MLIVMGELRLFLPIETNIMLKDYFKPLVKSLEPETKAGNYSGYFQEFPGITEGTIVLFGLEDNTEVFREKLYSLAWKFGEIKWCDLGTLMHKNTRKNMAAGLETVLHELYEMGCFPIVIGGYFDLSETIYKAYSSQKKEIEYCKIAPGLELKTGSALYDILLAKPNNLFNFTLLAQQSYYVPEPTEKKLNDLLFDTCRLGTLRNSIFNAEPAMRNSHLLSMDMSAIKKAEYPASPSHNPNGLYAEEACQLMRFAGLSCNLETLYIHNIGDHKNSPISGELLAQCIWFFLQGREEKIYDIPDKNSDNFTIYRNTISNGAHEIVFLKSNHTERWWMEIPNPRTNNPFYVACTYNDFLKVSNDEMPDAWWKFYQKVM
jgi:hypothetical protein